MSADHDTDDTIEMNRDELEQLIDERVKERVKERLPTTQSSRRDLLKAGGALGLGGLLGGAAVSGGVDRAAADTAQPDIGTHATPVDAILEAADFTDRGSDPSSPPSGHVTTYVKNGSLYKVDANGTVSQLGGGAFKDTDGDAVAELQTTHTDHGGGDLRGVGKATVSNADVNSLDAKEVNNKVQVSSESELRTAISNGRRNIEIVDVITNVTSPVVVDSRGTTMYGEGFDGHFLTNERVVGAGIEGSIDNGGLIDVQARDVTIRGIGLRNNSTTEGVAIEKSAGGLHLRVDNVDIQAYNGVVDTSNSNELYITNCLIWSISGGASGTQGISTNSPDSRASGNVLVGFETGIKMSTNSRVSDNHIYGASSGKVGVIVSLESTVIDNQIDVDNGPGASGDRAVEINRRCRCALNQIRSTGDADGIYIKTGSYSARGITVKNNDIDGTSAATADTAIALDTSATDMSYTQIEENDKKNFNSEGVVTKTEVVGGNGVLDLTTSSVQTVTLSHDMGHGFFDRLDVKNIRIRTGGSKSYNATVNQITNITDSTFDVAVYVSDTDANGPFTTIDYTIEMT